MKTKVLIILIILIGLGGGGYIFWEKQKSITGVEWFQTENTQKITQLKTKQTSKLEDNRIGLFFPNLWDPEMYAFPDGVLDADHILKLGVKRVRLAINTLDSNNQYCPIYWSKSELSIDPSHDDLITSLADNGVTMTYVLIFWDIDYVAGGGEINIPRFKTEEEILRYLNFVRFIVHHFKDRIEYYEIWNEPNIDNTIQWIEVEDYINLVKRAVPVIREEYPDAKIVVGSTSELSDPYSQNYLFSILRSDIMPLVDVVSWHPMYGNSPEYDGEYYYNYPSLVQEIKDVASAHGFEGEYEGGELNWCILDQADLDHPGNAYSETVSAKYYARGIVMQLGMDISTSIILMVDKPQVFHTSQNLCTLMAGANPIELPIEIQSEATNIRSYSFSLSNGDKLIALWTDGVAVDDDSGVSTTLTIPNFSAQKVIGIDVLNGYQQSIIASNENGDLVIKDLIVRDYPLILQINK